MIRQNSTNLSLSMSELSSFLYFKFFSSNFAFAHAQEKIVMLIRIGHTCVAQKHKKTDLLLETRSEINFEFIKFIKICKLSPFDKNK